MRANIKRWCSNTSRRGNKFMRRQTRIRRQVLLSKARHFISLVRKMVLRKKTFLGPVFQRNHESTSITKKPLSPSVISLPPPSAFAELFSDISNPLHSSPTRLLLKSLSSPSSRPPVPPESSPYASPRSPSITASGTSIAGAIFSRLLSPLSSPSSPAHGTELLSSSSVLIKDTCHFAHLHYCRKKYCDYISIWKAFLVNRKSNASTNSDSHEYWTKKALSKIIKKLKLKRSNSIRKNNDSYNKNNDSYNKSNRQKKSIGIGTTNRSHFSQLKNFPEVSINMKKSMMIASNAYTHKHLYSSLSSLSLYTNFQMQLRRKGITSIIIIITIIITVTIISPRQY